MDQNDKKPKRIGWRVSTNDWCHFWSWEPFVEDSRRNFWSALPCFIDRGLFCHLKHAGTILNLRNWRDQEKTVTNLSIETKVVYQVSQKNSSQLKKIGAKIRKNQKICILGVFELPKINREISFSMHARYMSKPFASSSSASSNFTKSARKCAKV